MAAALTTSKKKCQGCKKYFPTEGMIKIPLGYICTFDCVNRHVKAVAKQKKQDIKQRKEALRPKSYYVKKAQEAVNGYIHQRDFGKGCISCDQPLRTIYNGGQYDAGHYRSRGSAPHLRFVVTQIHLQCKKCNRKLSGNIVEYRKGFIARYSVELVESIEADQRPRKYSTEQLKRIATLFRRRTRHYKKLREKHGQEDRKKIRIEKESIKNP